LGRHITGRLRVSKGKVSQKRGSGGNDRFLGGRKEYLTETTKANWKNEREAAELGRSQCVAPIVPLVATNFLLGSKGGGEKGGGGMAHRDEISAAKERDEYRQAKRRKEWGKP